MKKGRVQKGFLFLALAIMISSPLVMADFGEWWNKFSGKVTTQSADVSISVGNNAPIVYQVFSHATQNPQENTGVTYYFTFNASDADGVGNLNDATATVRINRSGITRTSSSCTPIDYTNDNTVFYNCTLRMEYYDSETTWTINATVTDNGPENDWNNSQTFTHGLLHAWQPVSFDGVFDFPAITTVSTDINSTDNAYIMNNTANDNSLSIRAAAIDLQGWTTTSDYIYANNFTFQPNASNTCAGTALVNNTPTTIAGATLNNGLSYRENISLCLRGVLPTIASQAYNSSRSGSWTIDTQT